MNIVVRLIEWAEGVGAGRYDSHADDYWLKRDEDKQEAEALLEKVRDRATNPIERTILGQRPPRRHDQ